MKYTKKSICISNRAFWRVKLPVMNLSNIYFVYFLPFASFRFGILSDMLLWRDNYFCTGLSYMYRCSKVIRVNRCLAEIKEPFSNPSPLSLENVMFAEVLRGWQEVSHFLAM